MVLYDTTIVPIGECNNVTNDRYDKIVCIDQRLPVGCGNFENPKNGNLGLRSLYFYSVRQKLRMAE
jgi:hypothetical protein